MPDVRGYISEPSLSPLQMSTSVPHSPPARTEASVCMTGVASTTVCAYQASMGRTASARGDPVSRQGECWPLGVSLRLDDVVKGGCRTAEGAGGKVLGLMVGRPIWGQQRIKPQPAKVSQIQGFSAF